MYHEAATLGYEVFCLGYVHQAGDLKNDFHNYIKRHGFEDVLEYQIEYAMRLIRNQGDLLYEEVHKLFSLCDEIEALRTLGCGADDAVLQEFYGSLKNWFRTNKKAAQHVAHAAFEEWQRSWWWYTDNL